jgi:hypothetical protein
MGVALSGYNGSNYGLDVVKISNGDVDISNLALTKSDGTSFYNDDSGLTTISGHKIFLYTDNTNDNIVLGRVGNGGDPELAS